MVGHSQGCLSQLQFGKWCCHLFLFKKYFVFDLCVYVCIWLWSLAYRWPQRLEDIKIKHWSVAGVTGNLSHLMWVLWLKLGSSLRVVSLLKHFPISPALSADVFNMTCSVVSLHLFLSFDDTNILILGANSIYYVWLKRMMSLNSHTC